MSATQPPASGRTPVDQQDESKVHTQPSSRSETVWGSLGDRSSSGGILNGTKESATTAESPGSPPPHVPRSSQDDDDSLIRSALQHGQTLASLRDAAVVFMRRSRKLAGLREITLQRRSQILHEWQHCADQRQFVNDSQKAFLHEATALYELGDLQFPTEQLLKRYQETNADHERQSEYAIKTQELEADLSNLEFKMQGTETRLEQAVQRLQDTLNEIALPKGDTYPPSSAPTEVSRGEVPVLVKHYFDKAGDVKLQSENMHNMEVDHREERTVRILQADQEMPLSMTDEEFEASWERAFAKAQEELDSAVRKADLARQVCLGEGLDPESYRKLPAEVDLDAEMGPQSDADAASNATSTQIYGYHVQAPAQDPIFEILRTLPQDMAKEALLARQFAPPAAGTLTPLDDRIDSWRQNVSADVTEPLSTMEAKSSPDHPSFAVSSKDKALETSKDQDSTNLA
ncbi:uncharacterized protein LTR77_005242 [Saxophila tyrrhenica]|uniref:Uncharacterized protein n=1 Tax=Saxophila tyrrhenica TaxID=1690608 RepID=A0AAV9PC73_9PEZI|nr:hypothetical protein LTR77_005242 [Saxophila tyrrhenica]